MAPGAAGELLRQVKALTKKNLLLLVTRHWVATLLQTVVIPLAIFGLLLNINAYGSDGNQYGIGSPSPIRSIQESIPDSQRLYFVKSPNAGLDIDTVIKTVSSPLAADKIVILNDSRQAQSQCEPNTRGVSGCYAIVDFLDSPLTTGLNRRWNYTIQVDQARLSYGGNVYSNTNDVEMFQLPVQLAVDNAITNSTAVPEHYMFSRTTQEAVDASRKHGFTALIITMYSIIFFLGVVPSIYHAVGFVTRERADGVSQLVDAMGSGPAARVLSSVLSLGAVQFITWIVTGASEEPLHDLLLLSSPTFCVWPFFTTIRGWPRPKTAGDAAVVGNLANLV